MDIFLLVHMLITLRLAVVDHNNDTKHKKKLITCFTLKVSKIQFSWGENIDLGNFKESG